MTDRGLLSVTGYYVHKVSLCGGPLLNCSSACNVLGVVVQMQFGIPGAGVSEVNNYC